MAVSCPTVSVPSTLMLTVRKFRERVIVAALISCGPVLEYGRRSRVEELLLSVTVGFLVLLHLLLLPFLPFSLLQKVWGLETQAALLISSRMIAAAQRTFRFTMVLVRRGFGAADFAHFVVRGWANVRSMPKPATAVT